MKYCIEFIIVISALNVLFYLPPCVSVITCSCILQFLWPTSERTHASLSGQQIQDLVKLFKNLLGAHEE